VVETIQLTEPDDQPAEPYGECTLVQVSARLAQLDTAGAQRGDVRERSTDVVEVVETADWTDRVQVRAAESLSGLADGAGHILLTVHGVAADQGLLGFCSQFGRSPWCAESRGQCRQSAGSEMRSTSRSVVPASNAWIPML
jgi:hypothetical protein